MYSNLKSIISFPEKKEDIFPGSLPFNIKGNFLSIADFYDLQFLRIQLYDSRELDWDGIFFYKELNGLKYIFSGGRFGYAGFFSFNPKRSIPEYLPFIEAEIIKLDVATCSLASSYLLSPSQDNTSWNTTNISYLVANRQDSVNQDGLCFKKAIVRSNLSRNLKKAHKNEIVCKEFFDYETLRKWHEECHLPRISELNGKIWDLELLNTLLENGSGSVLCALNSFEEILGGCFILKSPSTLEIFMMSTTRENQMLGVNHLIAEKIYLLAHDHSIDHINWQASNPPDSPLVRFKKEWNCEERSFQVFSKTWSQDLQIKFIEENFKDCFIFPFSAIL